MRRKVYRQGSFVPQLCLPDVYGANAAVDHLGDDPQAKFLRMNGKWTLQVYISKTIARGEPLRERGLLF